MATKLTGSGRVCPSCGKEIENPNINYCLNCNNVFWSRPMRENGIDMVK